MPAVARFTQRNTQSYFRLRRGGPHTPASEGHLSVPGLPCCPPRVCLPRLTPPCPAAGHHHRHAGRGFLRPGPPETARGHHQAAGACGQAGGGKEGVSLHVLLPIKPQSGSNFPQCVLGRHRPSRNPLHSLERKKRTQNIQNHANVLVAKRIGEIECKYLLFTPKSKNQDPAWL